MLTCRDLTHQADAYLDGELGLWARLRVRLHLSMCHGCSRFMSQMRDTRSLLKAEASNAPSRDAEQIDDILAALRTPPPPDGQ